MKIIKTLPVAVVCLLLMGTVMAQGRASFSRAEPEYYQGITQKQSKQVVAWLLTQEQSVVDSFEESFGPLLSIVTGP